MKYNPQKIEKKWQKRWKEQGLYRAEDFSEKPKKYILVEFPYPSGAGLHVGHVRSYTALDIVARKCRMQGQNVLYPMGWDAFGLPTENYAIKNKIHPSVATRENVATFKKQIQSLGISSDWSREINTTDPEYYKWTQWIFLELFKRGLAYKKKMAINWCPSCKTGLANEEVVDGSCERCGTPAEQREREQWMLAITKYADRLIDDLDTVEYLEKIKTQQKNWIGRSEGTEVQFAIQTKHPEKTIVLATNNDAKKARVKNLFTRKGFSVDFQSLSDAGIVPVEVEENGSLEENAVKKALAYVGKTNFSVLANDTSLVLEGVNLDPVKVKRNALEGVKESELSQDEIAEKMLAFYQKIIREKGGEVSGYWHEVWALAEPDGTVRTQTAKREVIFTETVSGEVDPYFPLRSLYRSKVTGKYHHESTDEDYIQEMQPVFAAVRNLIFPTISVFTTRVDTIFSAAFLVVAPEHGLIENVKEKIENIAEVQKYVEQAKKKTALQRTDLAKEKTGVELKGVKAINPVNGEELPVWVADFVLGGYGTGAVFGDAHDERDFEFAKKYGIPLRQSIVPFFSDTTGKDTVRPDAETVRRKTAFAFVKHWSEDKYLCLDWEKFGWHSGIIGGIEGGESAQEAAMREITEETGYAHPEFVRFLGGEMHTSFYAAHKGVNRYAEGVGMLFQLKDDAWEKPNEEETKNHKAVWIPESEMEKFLNLRNFQYMWEILSGKRSECFTDDGILIDSGEFTGLVSQEAREKITAWLEKEGKGKRQVHYKLRDWVFSRQHYWGEPIPLVHCEQCSDEETEVKMEINFRDDLIWKAIREGKKTVETRALNPEESNRFFGSVKAGDALRLVNKNSGEKKVYTVTDVYVFKNVEDLFENKEILSEIFSGDAVGTIDDLKKRYASLSPEYLKKIEENGLVAWRLKKATKVVPVPEEQLPITLPDVASYEPTDTGESPLAKMTEWVHTACPVCGSPASRETDTMPNWAGSSWYFLRYIDPKNTSALADPEKLKYWMPIDLYNGGMEHTTLHLLYSRFWNKFLYDIGVVPVSEPYHCRRSHGMILSYDGQKMSKSKGNVINPDDVVREFGADSIRLYEMFMGPFSEAISWNTEGVSGVRRFLEKVWKLFEKVTGDSAQGTGENKEIENLLHKTIKKVTEDIEGFRFNTAVSSLMILVNRLEKESSLLTTHYSLLTLLLSPFAPHIAEELWEKTGHTTSIFLEKWPSWDEKLIADETITMVVQVNGKVRDTISVPADIAEDEAKKLALESEKVQKFLDGKEVRKTIFVKGKLVNVVV